MYTRQLLPQREEPVENGKPIQGTWTTPFEKVDMSVIDKPYRIPFPAWILDYRLKEWQTFTVRNDDIRMEVFIANLKFFSFVEIIFLDRRGEKKLHIFKMFPFSAWKMPKSLNDSVIEQVDGGFSFCVHNNIASRSVTLDVSIDSAIERPVFGAHLVFDTNIQKTTPMTVNMLMAESRPMYIFKNFAGVEGGIVWGDVKTALRGESASGLFQDCKGFIPYRARYINCRAFSFDDRGRRLGFSMGEHITRKLNVTNENALWLDGALTPLPPVRITEGESGQWSVQDLEGLIDLNFKLIDGAYKQADLFFIGIDHSNPAGLFNGMLTTRDGEKLPVRNVPGTIEYFNFRL
ncbi:MAG: DUF2804 domain-containing protein [Spirochaetaceae bacterium]|jgi:hypothetical protein|nr:DUF2804 domain-containing protein [Spirochaetaceae bacterium]